MASWLTKTYHFAPDLDAYFDRINYSGSRDPTAETLKQIQWHHLLSCPFESIDVHLLGKIDLSPDILEKKIVHNRRGGYCFEHNHYLLHVLRALGFNATPILARSIWQKPADIVAPATHLLIKVDIDGVLWMFDVGYSNYGTPYPLEIETDKEQPTPLESRRIIKTDNGYIHQMQLNEKWNDMFIFTLNESYPFDWEVGNYFIYTHPTSFCVASIMVSMPTEKCRHLLMNKVLTTRFPDGRAESYEIKSESAYFELLKSLFGLTFPEGTRLCPPNTTW